MANEPTKTRAITLRLSEADLQLMDRTSERMMGSTASHAIRTSIRVVDRIIQLQDANKKIGYIDESGKFVEIMFFL